MRNHVAINELVVTEARRDFSFTKASVVSKEVRFLVSTCLLAKEVPCKCSCLYINLATHNVENMSTFPWIYVSIVWVWAVSIPDQLECMHTFKLRLSHVQPASRETACRRTDGSTQLKSRRTYCALSLSFSLRLSSHTPKNHVKSAKNHFEDVTLKRLPGVFLNCASGSPSFCGVGMSDGIPVCETVGNASLADRPACM